MSAPDPLPFRAKLPGKESISFTEIREVAARVEGLLHLDGDELVLEWELVEEVDEVSLGSVTEETVRYEVETLAIPLAWLRSAGLVGGILRPRLRLVAVGLGAFGEMPAATGQTLDLPYARRDRLVAVAMRDAIAAALVARAAISDPVDTGRLPIDDTPLPD